MSKNSLAWLNFCFALCNRSGLKRHWTCHMAMGDSLELNSPLAHCFLYCLTVKSLLLWPFRFTHNAGVTLYCGERTPSSSRIVIYIYFKKINCMALKSVCLKPFSTQPWTVCSVSVVYNFGRNGSLSHMFSMALHQLPDGFLNLWKQY